MSIPVLLADAAVFIAQTTGPAVSAAPPTTQQEIPAWARFMNSLGIVPLFALLILFIWFSSRSRRRQEKQKQDMLSAMKRGDRVQTIGGILGNVVEVRDDRILLKVDESNNTKVWFARSAIHRVLGEEAEATKK